MKIKAVAILAAWLTLGIAHSTTYFCSAGGGNDGNLGTSIESPWKTLQYAIPKLSAGDVLNVRAGTYTGLLAPVLRAGTATAPITVKNYPGEHPLIQALVRLNRPMYWTFDGLRITWPTSGAGPSDHLCKLTNGAGWTVKNCEVFGAKSYACILVAGNVANEPANWKIAYCKVHDTYPTNAFPKDHNLYISLRPDSGKGTITRNLIWNAPNGENIKLAGPDNTTGTANVTVSYNTLYNAAQNVLVAWKSHDNLITRNLLVKSSTAHGYGCIRSFELVGLNNVASYNLGFDAKSMFLNYASPTQQVKDLIGNIFGVDPKFDSIGVNGFHPLNAIAQPFGRYAP